MTKFKDFKESGYGIPSVCVPVRLFVRETSLLEPSVPRGRNIIQRYLDTDTVFSSQEKMVQEPDEFDIWTYSFKQNHQFAGTS